MQRHCFGGSFLDVHTAGSPLSSLRVAVSFLFFSSVVFFFNCCLPWKMTVVPIAAAGKSIKAAGLISAAQKLNAGCRLRFVTA